MTPHTDFNVQAIAIQQCLSYFALSAEPNSQVGSHQQTQVQAHLDEGPLSSGASAATAVKADEASCGDSALKVKTLPNIEATLCFCLSQCIHTEELTVQEVHVRYLYIYRVRQVHAKEVCNPLCETASLRYPWHLGQEAC